MAKFTNEIPHSSEKEQTLVTHSMDVHMEAHGHNVESGTKEDILHDAVSMKFEYKKKS